MRSAAVWLLIHGPCVEPGEQRLGPGRHLEREVVAVQDDTPQRLRG